MDSQQQFYDKLKRRQAQCKNTETDKSPVFIDPFDNIDPFSNPDGDCETEKTAKCAQSTFEVMDLNIDNYSIQDIYKLFGLQRTILTENAMKESKKIVLKTHPDKSKLDSKYFLFFSKAYKRLFRIYEFQKQQHQKTPGHYSATDEDSSESGTTLKSSLKSSLKSNDPDGDSKAHLLSKLFRENEQFEDSHYFNTWFNNQFEKTKIEDDERSSGYGDWLKSDEDLVTISSTVTEVTMATEMEKHKKKVQALTTYDNKVMPARSMGSARSIGSSSCGAELMQSSNAAGFDGLGYTDLRQAYVESVIPVTQDDFDKIPKFDSVEAYKSHRAAANIAPQDKTIAMRQLYNDHQELESESAALAYHFAKQSDAIKEKDKSFWAELKQLTY